MQDHQILIDNQFVSAKVEQVVLAIRDYEPDISVKWLPVGVRQDQNGDPLMAFEVVYAPPGAVPFTLFYVKDESEFDERVLQRIIVNDQRRGPAHTYDDIRAFEKAAQLVQKQRELDELEEAHDMVRVLVKSKLNDFKFSKDLRIKEGIPFNAAHIKD